MTQPASAVDPAILREKILSSLQAQGFEVDGEGVVPPSDGGKANLRALHATARAAAIERARPGLHRFEDSLLAHFANGDEIAPAKVRPRLEEVVAGSEAELLFRYARLSWSVPVSAGYGRRVRFLVWDDSTGKLMGLFGLGDPVFGLRPRDEWIGWDLATRRKNLRHVMDAFVVGAVPPYSSLLCGKFVAMLLVSDEVERVFRRKYRDTRGLISDAKFDGRLALITTSSALGRSSLYNRVRLGERPVLQSVGYTSGSGEFHFSNGVYADLIAFARETFEPSAKNRKWGSGWRSRREVVRRSLRQLDLPPDMVYHGIRREVFVAPRAKNTREFLRGEHQRLRRHHMTADDAFAAFRERWLIPRSERDVTFRQFERESLRLWPVRS